MPDARKKSPGRVAQGKKLGSVVANCWNMRRAALNAARPPLKPGESRRVIRKKSK